MDKGKELPMSRYFSAGITFPQLSVRDQPLKPTDKAHSNRALGMGSQLFSPAAHSTCLLLLKRRLFPYACPAYGKKLHLWFALICTHPL